MTWLLLGTLLVIALVILWLPTYTVALLLQKLGAPRPFSDLRIILPAQLLAVIGLVALANAIGLRHPAGYTLAITVGASLAGAAILWRRHRPVI